LFQAILDANAAPGADFIRFTVPAVLADQGVPDITDTVTIDGAVPAPAGRVTITGLPIAPCFSSGFSFSQQAQDSTLANVKMRGFCESVILYVTGVHVVSSDLEYLRAFGETTITNNRIQRVAVGSSDSLIADNVIDLLTVFNGERNIVRGNDIDELRVTASHTLIENNTLSHRVSGSDVTTAIALTNVLFVSMSYATVRGNHISNYQIGVGISSESPVVTAPTGVTITQNDISNVTIPIDLGRDGVTPNDPAPDADAGANNLQNFPVLTSAIATPSQLTVTGTLSSVPSTSFRVELFASPAADAEARRYLAFFNVTTDASGRATFTNSVTTTAAADEVVTATATNAATEDTSEVSAAVAVDAQLAAVPMLSGWMLCLLAASLCTFVIAKLP
jgi:hypothetical protein